MTWDKEHKRLGYLVTNLPAFDTSNTSLAEELIWASICAEILKRFLAHATERVFRVAISTGNVTMSVRGFLFELIDAMTGSTRRLKIVLTDALAFLASNAQRHTLSEISYAVGLSWDWGRNMRRLKN